MKAIRVHELGGPETLRLDELPIPRPGPGRVLIRVAVSGLNFADTAIRRGRFVMQPALPYVPGFEVAGTVVARGAGVDPERFPLGSRVAALTLDGGGYAEFVVARAAHTIALPTTLSFEEGAAFPLQGLSAYHALTTMGRLRAGETVAVLAAAGGVGTLALQLARLLGAGRVIALVGGPEKLRLVRELGADDAIDYLRENFPARINEITEGRGADLIVESVGGTYLERCFECLAVMGRVITLGNTSGVQADLNGVWSRLRNRSQALIGLHLSAVLDRPELREPSIQTLLQLLTGRQLQVVIGGVFRLEEASAAQAMLENRRSIGKILLRVV